MPDQATTAPAVLRFELPYGVVEPAVVNPDAGLARLTVRRSACYRMDVTILDTPDNRLLRAGVVLAHRIVDELGEWYLAAPDWAPRLPEETTERVGAAADLPEDFAIAIRPFRRLAPVGPIAALGCERAEYTLRHTSGEPLATIRDDQVTVRRGGLTTNRYRECTVWCLPHLTDDQRDLIVEAMLASSASQVDEFGSLQTRLGAPATGRSDFPEPQPLARDCDLEHFVQHLCADHLRELVEADLDLRSGDGGPERLVDALRSVWVDVRGLAPVLDPAWRSDLEADLAPLTQLDAGSGSLPLLGSRLFAVIDALVAASRAPKLGDLSTHEAAPVLRQRIHAGTLILADRCAGLDASSPDAQWAGAIASAEQLRVTSVVTGTLLPKLAGRFIKRLDKLTAALSRCVAGPDADLAGLSVREAFEAGRRAERHAADVRQARKRFITSWPREAAKLRKLADS